MFAPFVVGLLFVLLLVKCSKAKKPESSSRGSAPVSAPKSVSPNPRSVPNTSKSTAGTPALTSDRSGSGVEPKPEEQSKDLTPAVDPKLSKTQNVASFVVSGALKSPDLTQQNTLPQSTKPKQPSPSRQEKTKDVKVTQATMTVSAEQLKQRTPEAKTSKPVQATCSKEKTKTKNPSQSKERNKTKHQSKSKDKTKTKDRSKMETVSGKKKYASAKKPIETAKEITEHRTSEDDSDTFKNVKSIRDVVKADKELKEKKKQQQQG